MAKPITFKESNRILQPGNHPGYEVVPLHIFSDGDYCVSCWRLNLRERFSALFFGKTWLYILSGTTQPPVYIEVMQKGFIDKEETNIELH